MRKWEMILAMVLAVIGMVIILPMNNVQAGKKLFFLEMEVETEETTGADETGQEEAVETKTETTTEVMTEVTTETIEETESETQALEISTEEIATGDCETEIGNLEYNAKKEMGEDNPLEKEELSVNIEDHIEEGFYCRDGMYIKRATHTISLTRVEKFIFATGKPNTDPDIYESISYIIFENTDNGEINLKEGSLEIPNKEEKSVTNKIEMEYNHSGNYGIKVKGRLKKEGVFFYPNITEVEFICHLFSIEKDVQEITFKQDSVDIYYDDVFCIDDYVEIAKKYEYWTDYEIHEESKDKNRILEIEKKDEKYYIKAVGINDTDKGTTTVTVKLKENPFMNASEEITLTVNVSPMKLRMETQTMSAVYLYDTLAINVILQKDKKDVTEELFQTDQDLMLSFNLVSGEASSELNSKILKREKGNSYTFYIPVKREYFKNFSKGTKYDITIELKYMDGEKAYFPYQVNTSEEHVELLGRKATMNLLPEKNGIYDYRAYYKGALPILSVQIEDSTASLGGTENLEVGKKALFAEAEEITYQVSSEDEKVVSVDDTRKYTAKSGEIPLHVNGVGTTILTVTTEGNSVYTVESQKIEITVENSPLYDEDFGIRIENFDNTEKQSFYSDAGKSGFQKWKEYLAANSGWVRGCVSVELTKSGLEYYEQIGMMRFSMTEDGHHIDKAKRLQIDGDKEITEYTLWAENNRTKADTRNVKDGEDGTRTFKMGIDTTAPEIERFIPSDDYYVETSTDTEQYFPEKFVLTGSFQDATSGVARIEYTTEYNAMESTEWIILEKADEAKSSRNFRLELKNGSYNAVAVRAFDAAGNVSEPVCLKNETGAFIKIIVDNTPPDVDVSVMTMENDSTWCEYNAEGENWTNKTIKFEILEKASGDYAGLYKVQYAYRSIAAALCGEPIAEEEWQELVLNDNSIDSLLIGENREKPDNKNGCYYFRGVSRAGVISANHIEKRILLWQKMADKEPVSESGADMEKCYNEWYNKASGMPIIDFAYPKYETGAVSGEYAAPITLHYNLSMKDEKDGITSLTEDKTASIWTDGLEKICDDLSEMQVVFSDDGIYTLEYWITDAAGNESEVETLTYKIDCHEPTALKLALNGEEQVIGNESALIYEKFYQSSVSGEASAEYGISGKDSIKLLKAKKIGEWNDSLPTEGAEQFEIEPNMRCLLYIRAVDGAGNMAEGWTKGIVVDKEAPTGDGMPQLIVEPEGANKHGFFNKDVKVKISIKDAPNDGNSAGLKLVTVSVGTDDGNTISDKELFSSIEEHVSETLMNETEGFCITETIDARANEGNHAYISVRATDRSENMSTDMRELKIDVTKPEIEITFDNENAVNGRYYNADRKAKINIKELNFDASLVTIKVTRNGEKFTPSISDWQSDNDNHYAYINFSADGDYVLTVECTDLADNESEKESTKLFTIDKTMPKIKIELENGDSQNTYFNKAQTAVITVIEHNFNEDDFQFNIQPAGKIGSWEHKNDTHVIKMELLSEGKYAVSCDYKDLAGNELSDADKAEMPMEFVIDITNPVIEISGVEDNSANAGEVIPSITVRDLNIEPADVVITLTTGKGMVIDIHSDITMALAEGEFLYTINGFEAKQDDIYYLTVNAADKAGNTEELTYRFSLNRRGSAYDFTGLTNLMNHYYNSYKNLEDIKIVEMNVDKVEEFVLYLSHNAEIIYGKSGSRPLSQNENQLKKAALYSVDVSGNEDTGYVYTYTVYRENFAREGTYRLGIYSKDRAGNEVNNLLKQNGQEIQFVVDNTMPRVIIDGVENNEIYDVESQEVRVAADDNFKLAEAELTLVGKDGEVLQSWNYFDLVEREGDTARIFIEEYDEEVSLLYKAVDAAGNEVSTFAGEKEAKADFLVTTDKFVQLVSKPEQTPVGRIIIIVLSLFMLGTLLVAVMAKISSPK